MRSAPPFPITWINSWAALGVPAKGCIAAVLGSRERLRRDINCRLRPEKLFHTALRAILRDLEAQKTPFQDMTPENQDVYLKSLEAGAHDLDGIPSAIFFDTLLKMTVEGFFADPVYGGNRDMVAWRMIGFPGAYADYFEAIDRHGVKFVREPMSLAEDGKGHIHMRQDIPANL